MAKIRTMLTVLVELAEEITEEDMVGLDLEERYITAINRALFPVEAVQRTTLVRTQVFRPDPDVQNIELLGCPFCGGFSAVHTQECEMDPCPDAECEYCEERCYRVLCDEDSGGCGASSGWYESRGDAADGWNERAKKG